jgi:hypothetical protein
VDDDAGPVTNTRGDAAAEEEDEPVETAAGGLVIKARRHSKFADPWDFPKSPATAYVSSRDTQRLFPPNHKIPRS